MGSDRRPHIAVLALVATLASTAAAEPTAADRETARGLMDQGKARIAENDLPGALRAFSGAHAIMNVPTTGIALAKAQLAVGQLIEARATLLSVVALPPGPNESAPFAAARAEAETLAAELAVRIPAIVVLLRGDPQNPVVTVDGSRIPAAALGLPLKVNPGKHKLTASAPGYRDAVVEVGVVERESKDVSVTLEKAARDAAAPVPVASAQPTTRPAPRRPPPEPAPRSPDEDTSGKEATSMSPWVYRGLAIATGGVIVGSVAGVISLSKTSSAKESCEANVCPPSARGDVDSARTFATISNVGFGFALVGLAVSGIALASPSKRTDTAVVVGPTSALLRGSF